MRWFKKSKVEPEPVLRTPVLELCDVRYPVPCANPSITKIHGWKVCEAHKPGGSK